MRSHGSACTGALVLLSGVKQPSWSLEVVAPRPGTDGEGGTSAHLLVASLSHRRAEGPGRARQRGEIPISGRRARTWRDLPGDGRPPARPPPRTARLRRWGPSPRPPGLDGAMQPSQRWCFYFDGATGCCSAAAFGLGSSKQCTKRQVHHVHARAQAEAGGSAGHVARGGRVVNQ